MADSEFSTSIDMLPPTPTFLIIPSKPTAPISYSFFPETQPASKFLIVFVNGLGLPASSWAQSIKILHSMEECCPPILTYDRFGQGLTTARDPLDGTPGKENGHDFLDVVKDLHEIIITIAKKSLHISELDINNGKLPLLLIGHSIGGPIVRLYTQHHPGIVAGAVILDSNICNMNYSDFLPDPDAPGFDPSIVIAPDCTLEQYREARKALAAHFDLNVPNAENIDRSVGPSLLPNSDGPKLVGLNGTGLLLSVVGHDPVTFAESSFDSMGTPISMTMKFTNAYWEKYK
ncbi:hypothetical protein B0O99DRAFT_626099 [Bisporella sp. PMI_857]|nr:hypothetical protein B0O99DRAFT_626099 [Bisporella sp. PMI_857]